MTKEEFRNLPDYGAMRKIFMASEEMQKDSEFIRILKEKWEEEEKAWQIEHFGHYDPDLLFDPMPKKRSDN